MSATPERLTPARLRKPSLGEAAMHGGWTLFVESFKRYAWSKRSLVLALLFAMPSVLVMLVRMLNRDPDAGSLKELQGVERSVILTFAPTTLLSFAALLNAAGLIQDEIEEQTLTYLLLRPTPRWMIYLAKLLAATLATVILACVFHTISYLCLYSGRSEGTDALRTSLPASMAALALATAAYSSVFGLIGLVLKRSLVVGVLYIVIFEGILALIPFNFRNYTIAYHFRVLCHHWVDVPADFWGLLTNTNVVPYASSSATILLSAAAVFAFLGAVYTQRKEFRMKTPAGA
jgi:ABC-2 type transport system permease protein